MIEHATIKQLHGMPIGSPAAAHGAVDSQPHKDRRRCARLPPRRLCASCSPLAKAAIIPSQLVRLPPPPPQGTMRAAALLLALLAGAVAVQGAQLDATLLLCSRSCPIPRVQESLQQAALPPASKRLAVAAVSPPPPRRRRFFPLSPASLWLLP